MLEPFDFRSAFSTNAGFLTTWSQRWITQLISQINSILNSIGIKSLNGDTTPAQTLVAGANVSITNDGKGKHTIAASSTSSTGLTSINGDATPAQVLANGKYIEIIDNGGGKHTVSCTLTPSTGATLYGQFADDTAAAAAAVPVGGMYYLPTGFVVVRQS